MADSKHEDTFKVVDRRLFGEDGELRKDVVEQERRTKRRQKRKPRLKRKPRPRRLRLLQQAKPQRRQRRIRLRQTRTCAGAAGNGSALAGVTPEDAAAEAQDSGEMNPTSRSFQMLIDFLTRNAAAMLGGMADPRTGQAFVDLEGAREVIDMLDALREKTNGQFVEGR